MKTPFIKRIAGIMAFLMLTTQFSIPVYATTGACSGHDGVNCLAGADSDGSVICNDGWTDSSVKYVDMENECGDDYIATSDDTSTDPTGVTTDGTSTDPTGVTTDGTSTDPTGVTTEEKEEPTELSEDVSVTNVVDVVSEDTGDVSETTGGTLVDEAVEEIVDELEGETESEIAEAVESIEADIISEIEDLIEEGDANPDLRPDILRRIQHLKELLAKLRATIIKRHTGIINRIRYIKNHPAVYSIRWGDLSGINHCAGVKPAEIIQDLVAGEIPCEIEAFEYSGTISVDTGKLKVHRKVLFEPNYDEVTQMEGSSISFDSTIAGHWDGLIVEFIPDVNDDGTKLEVNVTISLGDLNNTYTGSEATGRKDIGNGNMIEIKRIAHMLPGVAQADQDKLIEQKINVQEKISDVHDKIYRLRMLGKNKEVLDEIENAVDEAEEYNFDEVSSDEVQSEIADAISQLNDTITKEDINRIIQRLKRVIAEIKARARGRKFNKRMIPFKDTDDDSWYTQYVAPVKNRGIISGYKDEAGNPLGEYRPANNITVAEILKIALETAGKGKSGNTPRLNAALNHWARGYVARAEELGLDIISGDVDLNRLATRAEVIRIMLEALGIEPDTVTKSDFFDVLVSHVHAAYIQYAKDLGIISGDAGTNNFRPDDPINRAEAAKIADLIFGIIMGGSDTIGGDEPWE